MTNPNDRSQPLRPAFILRFWLPLAATWLMMAAEGPYIAAIIAREPEAAHNLAAYGVAFSIAWLLESPIMMFLSASNALVRDRASYFAFRRFAFTLNVLVTAAIVVVVSPPVFRFIGETLIGLPPDISRSARIATAILIPWPAAIGFRRFYQGILVRHHMTRRVAYGTVVRLVSMSVVAGGLATLTSIPGAFIGSIALVTGVTLEALASRWMARHIVRSIVESDAVARGTLTAFADIARFYYPLAITSMLSMALGPVVTFGLGRGRSPIESLAVWPVISSLLFLFRSGGVGYQEVGVALMGRSGDRGTVERTALWLGLTSSLCLAAVALTPLETIWFERVSGLAHELAVFTTWPVRLMILLPALEYVLSIQRSRLIVSHRTRVITVATAIETGGLAVALLVMVGAMGMVGAVAGAIATMVGRVAANAFLFLRGRRIDDSRAE